MSWRPAVSSLSNQQTNALRTIQNNVQSRSDIITWISGMAGNGKTIVMLYAAEAMCKLHPEKSICFVTYTHALKDLFHESLLPEFQSLIDVKTHMAFMSQNQIYDFVFLDEIQDITEEDLDKIHNLSRRLVVAGDFGQCIYPDNEPISRERFISLYNPSVIDLTILFRLGPGLKRFAQKIAPHELIGSDERKIGDQEVIFKTFIDQVDETSEIDQMAIRFAKPGSPVAILFPKKQKIDKFIERWAELKSLPKPPNTYQPGGKYNFEEMNRYFVLHQKTNEPLYQYFGNDQGASALNLSHSKEVVFLMTYHSSKGLDFPTVILPTLNSQGTLISEKSTTIPLYESTLLFVAMTRAKKRILFSWSKQPHRLIDRLQSPV